MIYLLHVFKVEERKKKHSFQFHISNKTLVLKRKTEDIFHTLVKWAVLKFLQNRLSLKKKYEIQLKTKEVIGKRVKKLKQIQF